MVLGALAAGTATAGGVYAYRNMRPSTGHPKQEDMPPSQLMPATTLFDQNQITSQKFVLKCELECFPSEKKSANEHKSDNLQSSEHETNTNLHPQENEESKEAKPDHFPANSVKLVSDESSGPLETSEFPQKMIILDTLSHDQDCLDLVILRNDHYQLPILNLQQCEFATVSAKQNEIQHRRKEKNTAQSSPDDSRDSKKCDCVKTAVKEEVITEEPPNEAQTGPTNWFSWLNTQEDSHLESDKIDPKKCGCARKKREEPDTRVDTKYWLGEENKKLKSCECGVCVVQDKVEQVSDWFGGLFGSEENSSFGDNGDSKNCSECEPASKENQIQEKKEIATQAQPSTKNWLNKLFTQDKKSVVHNQDSKDCDCATEANINAIKPANEALDNTINWIGGLTSKEDLKMCKCETQKDVERSTEPNSNKSNWSDGLYPAEKKLSDNEEPRKRSIQNRLEDRQKQENQGGDKKDSRKKTCVCNETKKAKEGLKILSTGQVVFAIDI